MHLRIVVGVPTVGRANVLYETLSELSRQTRQPDQVLVCATTPADFAFGDPKRSGLDGFYALRSRLA